MGTFNAKAGGVDKQLRTGYFLDWILPYMNDADLEGIIKNHNNEGEQLAIVDKVFDRANLPDSFTMDIYNDSKMVFIRHLEPRIIDKYPGIAEDKQKKDLGFRSIKDSDEKSEEDVAVKKSVITQRSSKGVVYDRKYNKWSVKETDFIRFRLKDYQDGKLSVDDMKKSLKSLNGTERSSGSITRKIRRIKDENKN